MSSLDFNYINSLYLEILSPLVKWKILDLKTLHEEGSYTHHIKSFRKLIARFEKGGIIKSFRDPWTGKKFVYLTRDGEDMISPEDSRLIITRWNLMHAAKVSEISKSLLNLEMVRDVIVNHDLDEDKKELGEDATLVCQKEDFTFNIAFRFVITRSKKQDVIDEIRHLLYKKKFEFIVYLFCMPNIYEAYKEIILEKFGARGSSKVLLFYSQTIISREIDLNIGEGFFNNAPKSFYDVFY